MPKLPEEMFDTRKTERYLSEGIITQAQLDEHLAGLEDCSADVDKSHIQMTAHARSRRFEPTEDTSAEEDEG